MIKIHLNKKWKPNLLNDEGLLKQFSVAILSWHACEPCSEVLRADKEDRR